MTQGPLAGYEYHHNALVTTVDVKELHDLRAVAMNWKHMLDQAKAGYEECMVNPSGFGPVRAALWVTRNVDQNGVIVQHVYAVEIPTEMLVWPFSK